MVGGAVEVAMLVVDCGRLQLTWRRNGQLGSERRKDDKKKKKKGEEKKRIYR